MQRLKDILGSREEAEWYEPQIVAKNQFALIGTVGSGKSTVVTLMVITTQTLSQDRKEYFCTILEKKSDIFQDISNMRDGHFPAKTVAFDQYARQSGLLMEKEGFWGSKTIQVPICDTAGEEQQMLIPQYRRALGKSARSAEARMVDFIKDSDGFIITVAAPTARRRFGKQLEPELDPNISRDPDVNLVRILNTIIQYRRRRKKPIKALVIVVTKVDEILDVLREEYNLDLLDGTQESLQKFVESFFPSVAQCIKAARLKNVKYFPSYVELEYDDAGKVKKWSDGSPKIAPKDSDRMEDERKPSYNELSHIQIIDFIMSYAS